MITSADILKASILVVDDQVAHSTLLEQILTGAGYVSVTATNNPREVCDLHRKNHYTLILLDLQMPGMDGFQVMEELKAIETGSYLPVLVLTAQPDHKLRALKAGARDFVSKPFDLAEVLMRAHNMIEVRLLHRQAELRTKRAENSEQAISGSELRYRRLFEAAPDGILILNVETGRITDVNPFLCKMLALSASEMIGSTVADLRPFKGIESNQAMLKGLQLNGFVRYEDLSLKSEDGRHFDVQFICSVYHVGSENVIQCNIRDITDRKRADEAQRVSEARYRTLFDYAPDGIVIADPQSYYLDANASMCRMLGYTRDELVGKQALHIVAPAEIPFIDKAPDVIKVEVGCQREWMVRRKNGSQFEAEVIATAMPDGNLLGMVRDITERKRAEEVLRGVSSRASRLQRRKTYRELGMVFALSAMVFFSGYISGLSDKTFKYIVSHDTGAGTYLDETVITLVFFCLAMFVFSYRRWRDSEAEALSQTLISQAMGILHHEMEAKVQLRTSEVVQVNESLRVEAAERKLAEGAARASESNMALAQSIAHIGSWELRLSNLTETDTNSLHWSDEVYRIAGYEPGKVSPSNELFFQLVPQQEHGRIQEAVAAAIAKREPYSIVHRFIRPSGEERIVHELAQVIIDEKTDQPLKLIGTIQDITERKRADEQIAEQAALLDQAQDAIVLADLESRIQFWNKGAERLYGWTREEALGQKITELIAAKAGLLKDIMAALLEKGEFSNEVEHVTKDGRSLTVEARRTLIRDDVGNPKSLLAIYTDVTEKKKIEAQFLRAQRMESIGTLAGGIAHDLNNILAPIMMSIDILKLSATDPQATLILETIEVSAKRGADIVRQVLSFARGLEGQRIEVQPKHLLKELETIIKDTFPKGIRLQFSVPNDTWTLLGDPTQVHQILLNLCVNARDAMPNGGNLTIRIENCEIDKHYVAMNTQLKAGRYVHFSVSDSGSGIPPGIRDKIFEPFFTTKDLNRGTGLGLSTVMAIVKSHEGSIDVYSEQGDGTTFNVYLPAVEISDEARKQQAVQASLPRGNGETVLVVDDEASILTITSQTLQAFGYQVLTAIDGADAIAVFAQHQNEIDVVLTDMMMPIMDGPAAIHALMRLNPTVKIVAASGITANESVAKAAGAGVKYFLTKPYTAATLLKTLRAILNEPKVAASL